MVEPPQQTMEPAELSAGPGASIEVLTPERYAEDFMIMKEFLSSKRMLCLVPLSIGDTIEGHTQKHSNWPADKQTLGAVAVVDGVAVGSMQLALHGHPCELHTVKPGECYVEHLAVSASARGQGIGTKLLKWCEETARSRGARYLSLGVIRGNPAIRLYERFGFVTQSADPCEACATCVTVACLFGRPYGCLNCHWGALYMVKQL